MQPTQPQKTKPKLQVLCLKSLKRTHDVFLSNINAPVPEDPVSQKVKIAAKIVGEYGHVKDMQVPARQAPRAQNGPPNPTEGPPLKRQRTEAPGEQIEIPAQPAPGVVTTEIDMAENNTVESVISDIAMNQKKAARTPVASASIVAYQQPGASTSNAIVAVGGVQNQNRLAMSHYQKHKKPKWHAQWKLKTVIAGHLGWVRSIAFEPGNEWFCTGAADRTIKLWDLASGTLKVTLTGHISTVRGLEVSDRHNYLFSCGEDKMVKCWDLEMNKSIRYYHGHLSGVYSLAMHPTLDVLITGGRDATVRVWDIRTKNEIHVLSGHTNSVTTVKTQGVDPQVVSASEDSTVKLWDLGMGKAVSTLTNHKKGVRAMSIHPTEFTFASASADNIKKWKFPHGEFITNFQGHNAIINACALNQDNVFVSCGDNGSMKFWDWTTGYCFQSTDTIVQPGSLESEAGIFACTYDKSGSRFITCEADKTIKIYAEDMTSTPDSHPVDPNWRPTRDGKRF